MICFTRTSSQIHELPHQYPSFTVSQSSTVDKETVKRLVFDPEKTIIRKLSTISTQAEIHSCLESAVASSTTKVCLLVANMQHLSTRIINHVRILLEEVEKVSLECRSNKVFVLLLCLTPKQFFYSPYPTLFLKGWEYYYLDTISADSSLKIHDWLRCCLQVGAPQNSFLMKALEEMLPKAITAAVSNVSFGCKAEKIFNCSMPTPQRRQLLEDTLVRKGVYMVLCEKFCSYWTPSLMLHYMQEAARISIARKSIVCMAESIQHTFKGFFRDFFTYMISVINQEWYLDILCDEQYEDIILAAFKDILRDYPTPALPQLSHSRHSHRRVKYTPIFPFFTHLHNVVDNLLELCKKKVSEEQSLPGKCDLPLVSNSEELFQTLVEELTTAVKVSVLNM